MITTHYTLELYNSIPKSLSSQERYEAARTVKIRPDWLDVYYHGTCGPEVRTRAFRTISAERTPQAMSDVELVCWKALESSVEHDPKSESAVELFERVLTETEKVLIVSRLQAIMKDTASDTALAASIGTWKKWGMYKESMSQLSLLLLQRNRTLCAIRTRSSLEFDKTIFPNGAFSVTSRIWVPQEFEEIAAKIASCITRIDSKRSVLVSVAEHSSKNPPTLQISRTYDTVDDYLKNTDSDDLSLDISLDLLLRIIATSYCRYYWTATL